MLGHFNNEQTEDYFRRFNAQLGRMPQQERAELHLELRQHLEALIAAHEELGASPEEALEAALRSFGEPKRIGRRMFHEWRRGKEPRRLASVTLRAAVYTVGWVMGLEAASLGVMCLSFHSWAGGIVNLTAMLVALPGAPLIAGALAGRRFGERAVTGVFYATLPIALILALANGTALNAVSLGILAWCPLGSLCASLTSARRGAVDRPRWPDMLRVR